MKFLVKLALITVVGVGGLGMMSGCARGFMPMNPQERAERLVKDLSAELQLNDAQVGKLNALKDELLAVRNDLQKKRGETSAIIGELLSQRTLDQARSLALIKERSQEVNDKAPQIVAAFAGFYDSLTPPQQRKLHDAVIERLVHH